MREQLERRRIAGAVVVLVKDGDVLFSRGYGYANIATGRPMTTDTLVRIGSSTKTLTAIGAMQLVESGRVDLDRDVGAYLDINVPESRGRAVTLRRTSTPRWLLTSSNACRARDSKRIWRIVFSARSG